MYDEGKFKRPVQTYILVMLILLVSPVVLYSQFNPIPQYDNDDYIKLRRETAGGDAFAFQGLENLQAQGVKAIGLGNAYTAHSGDLNSLFYNPAGLAGIQSIQFSIAFNNNTYTRYERDHYEPYSSNNMDMLEHLFNGLYVLSPQDTIWGMPLNTIDWDISRFKVAPDNQDYWDEDQSTWIYEESMPVINNVAVAVPFQLSDIKFVAAAAYSARPVFDHDASYVYSPAAALLEYRVTEYMSSNDGLDVPWYNFSRTREGLMHNITFAFSADLFPYLDIGLRYDWRQTKTDDEVRLSEIALIQGFHLGRNTMSFIQEKDDRTVNGTSEFASNSFSLGLLYKSDVLNVGLDLRPGYEITRNWDYSIKKVSQDTSGNDIIENSSHSGENSVKLPFSYAVGLLIKPSDIVNFSLDIEVNPFSKNEYNLEGMFYHHEKDSSFRTWYDQTIISLGIEVVPWDFLSILAGYRLVPGLIKPLNYNSEADLPKADVISVGASVRTGFGRFDVVSQWKQYRHIDIYTHGGSYNNASNHQLYLGYILDL